MTLYNKWGRKDEKGKSLSDFVNVREETTEEMGQRRDITVFMAACMNT